MSFEEHNKRIDRLIWLLKITNTGTADELAKKLNVSRRTIFNDFEYLRSIGHVIVFRQVQNSYMIKEKKEFLHFFKQCIVIALLKFIFTLKVNI